MTHKILYAEDYARLRKSFGETIGLYFKHEKIKDIEVITASNGQEAIAIIREIKGELALVITDMRMPFENGDKVAEEAIRCNIPVIFFSGGCDDLSAELKAKCRGIFDKTAKLQDVLATAKAAITSC